MSDVPYLIKLGNRLARGLQTLDAPRRQRHRDFLLSQQMPDGGFRGRDGDSDLYYTGFAVRALFMLGALSATDCDRIGRFLWAHSPERLNVVDLTSWLYSGIALQLASGNDPFTHLVPDWIDAAVNRLESLRRKDGGYAKSSEGSAGSTYNSFLVTLIYELVGRETPNTNALVQFVYDRQRDDGGFVEIGPMKNSGTNPTAAAAALLRKFGRVDEELRADLRQFLSEVRGDEGGFQANKRIPFSDGLSTFTGILTSQDLGLGDIIVPARGGAFLEDWLEFPTGGFRGASWDEQADVEYTFYGLGALALLSDRP
jgi:geranylgeranyl transferase type-2 subunit beta